MNKKILIVVLLLLLSITYMALADCTQQLRPFSVSTDFPRANNAFRYGEYEYQGFGYYINEYYGQNSWHVGFKYIDRIPVISLIYFRYFAFPWLAILLARLPAKKKNTPYLLIIPAAAIAVVISHIMPGVMYWFHQAVLAVFLLCFYGLIDKGYPCLKNRKVKNLLQPLKHGIRKTVRAAAMSTTALCVLGATAFILYSVNKENEHNELRENEITINLQTDFDVFMGLDLGTVKSLHLSGVSSEYNEQMRQQLSQMPKLQSLKLTGYIDAITGLDRLRYLQIVIGADGQAQLEIYDMAMLEGVMIRGPVDRVSLTNLPKCDAVNLWNVGGDLSYMKQWELKSLTTLSINNSEVESTEPISRLAGLRTLSLDNNNISDITPLSSLGDLRYLKISFNNISDISPLMSNTRLAELYAYRNPLEQETELATIRALKKLKYYDGVLGNEMIVEENLSIHVGEKGMTG